LEKLALFLQTKFNEYQQLLREDCQTVARAHQMGLRVFTADNNARRQINQIRELLSEAPARLPSAILVSPVEEESLEGLAREAGRRGIGWVVLNRWSDTLLELRKEFPHLPIFSVTPDQYRIGHLQGQQFKSLLPEGGDVVYLRGPTLASSARRRYEGLLKELSGTQIRVQSFTCDWSWEGGQKTIRDWVETLSPTAILPRLVVGAQNDSMAAGAWKALVDGARRHHRTDVMQLAVVGCDGATGFGRRLVAEGTLAATVLVPSVAGRAVTEIARCLKGEPRPPAEIVLDVSPYPEIAGGGSCRERSGDMPRAHPPRVSLSESRRRIQHFRENDAVLLQGLQCADADAQTALFDVCEPAVRRVISRILRRADEVADAVQDTFVRSFRNAIQVKEPEALRGWVVRVAETVALDQLRRHQRRRIGDEDGHALAELAADEPSFELRLAVRYACQVIEKLPGDERTVFALRYVDGMEIGRLATHCGVSLATIKRRLARAELRFQCLARREPGLSDWASL
jgi:RNA polymerase sigma-70 factor, ECF subfamily